jgi:hypothetical protein
MAKISAHGAHEVARIQVRHMADETNTRYVWVLTSDGRILSRAERDVLMPDHYSVYLRGLKRKLRCRSTLLRIALIRGYRVV